MCGFLCSFFNSLLITKRNLLTHLDCLLVLAMTLLTSLMVACSCLCPLLSRGSIKLCYMIGADEDNIGRQ